MKISPYNFFDLPRRQANDPALRIHLKAWQERPARSFLRLRFPGDLERAFREYLARSTRETRAGMFLLVLIMLLATPWSGGLFADGTSDAALL